MGGHYPVGGLKDPFGEARPGLLGGGRLGGGRRVLGHDGGVCGDGRTQAFRMGGLILNLAHMATYGRITTNFVIQSNRITKL